VGSLLGPIAVSLAIPLVPLTAGPAAGELAYRYRSVFVLSIAFLIIALLAGTATSVAVLVPRFLLLTLAGLALVAPLVAALREATHGPLVLGPVLAFAVALSSINLWGLGSFFWSLVVGTGVSWLLERDRWQTANQAEPVKAS
jgi:benzoate membrane transport protein